MPPQPRTPAREEIWQKLVGKPLADKMRPATLQEYIGQNKVVGQETLLRSLLESNEIPSLILWGPPGCGKVSGGSPSRRSRTLPRPPSSISFLSFHSLCAPGPIVSAF